MNSIFDSLAEYVEACEKRDFLYMSFHRNALGNPTAEMYTYFYQHMASLLRVSDAKDTIHDFSVRIADEWVDIDYAWFRQILFPFETGKDIRIELLRDSNEARWSGFLESDRNMYIEAIKHMPDSMIAAFLHALYLKGADTSIGSTKLLYAIEPKRLQHVLTMYFDEHSAFASMIFFSQALLMCTYHPDPHAIEQLQRWCECANTVDISHPWLRAEALSDCSHEYVYRIFPAFSTSTYNHVSQILHDMNTPVSLGCMLAFTSSMYQLSRVFPESSRIQTFDMDIPAPFEYHAWTNYQDDPYVLGVNFLATETLPDQYAVVYNALYDQPTDDFYIRVQRFFQMIYMISHNKNNASALEITDALLP